MAKLQSRNDVRLKRHARVRRKISGTPECPRLNVFRSNAHIHAQIIDDVNGGSFTAHTTNPVPFILVNADEKYTLREGGCLADIIPTLLELMGLEQPAEMTGKSLLIEK